MATKKPFRAPVLPQTIWTLIRVVKGEREILGQYSTDSKGQDEAQRIMAKEAGVRRLTHLPPWATRGDTLEFVHGRDKCSWWFRLEPFLLDAEQG